VPPSLLAVADEVIEEEVGMSPSVQVFGRRDEGLTTR
jgi:hypothetical protein